MSRTPPMPQEARATTRRQTPFVALVSVCDRPRLSGTCFLPLIAAQLRLPDAPAVVDDSSSSATRRCNGEAARGFEAQGGVPTIVVANRRERTRRQPHRRIQP